MDIPCDNLYVCFPLQALEEICLIEAWQGDRRLFYGPVDTQRLSLNSQGGTVCLWARSAAAYLVDNECIPCSYYMPTADTLFLRYAAEYGLVNCLPPLLLKETMDIPKGLSRWSALDSFVKNTCGRQMYVDSEKRLGILEPSGKRICYFDQPEPGFTQARVQIKRSAPIARAVFKKENSDTYNRWAQPENLAGQQLNSSRCINLSALAPWQRQNAVKQLLLDSQKQYLQIQLTLPGLTAAGLYRRAAFQSKSLGQYDDLLVTELSLRSDSKGVYSTITLAPEPIDAVGFYIE